MLAHYHGQTWNSAELDLMLFRGGKRWGFEFRCTDAPSVTNSMHIALADPSLEHLYAVYPGSELYRLHERTTALLLTQLSSSILPAQ